MPCEKSSKMTLLTNNCSEFYFFLHNLSVDIQTRDKKYKPYVIHC